MMICYVSLKQHNKNAGARFIRHIQELQEVIECYNISGEFDFMLKAVTESMDAYYDFHVNKLSQSEKRICDGSDQADTCAGVLRTDGLSGIIMAVA